MLKITLKNEKILIINNYLFESIKGAFIDDIIKIEETTEEKQTSFLIVKTKTNGFIFDGFIIDDKYKQYAQLLSYKFFKMYNYKVRIKRNAHFSTSDFEITLSSDTHKNILKYYLFGIEI